MGVCGLGVVVESRRAGVGVGGGEMRRGLLGLRVLVLEAAAAVGRLVERRLVMLRSLRCRVSGTGLGVPNGGIAGCTRGVVFVWCGGWIAHTDS